MCGIAGIIGDSSPGAEEHVRAMVRAVGHRGPDDEGILRVSNGALGHCRLSIIDLAGGHQPMTSCDGRFSITYNGEIYNYKELRENLLSAGHQLRTRSDTEVLLEMYRKHGAGSLQRLNGMFAFAIWDEQERSLFLARDRMGKKPLYYGLRPDGTLIFSSEIKGLLASGLLTPTLDLVTVDAFLKLGYVPTGECIYREIRQLSPAHYALFRNRRLETRRYWTMQFRDLPYRAASAREELRARVARAVQRRLLASDVPVGAFLSGGLDSSTIVLVAQSLQQAPLKTYGVHVEGTFDETPFARDVAAQAGCEYYQVTQRIEVEDLLEKHASVYDEPFADPAAIPTYYLSQFARQYGKVVLTGDGGDEIFGGYDTLYLPMLRSESVPHSGLLYRGLRLTHGLLQRTFERRGFESPLKDMMAAADRARRYPNILRRYTVNGRIAPDDRRRLLRRGGAEYDFSAETCPADIAGMNKIFWYDMNYSLPANMLVKVDRATMAHGLEARCPFLDTEVVEYALALELRAKIDGFCCKKMLRDAYESEWPASLRRRGKLGFAGPMQGWLQQREGRRIAYDMLHDNATRLWDVLSREYAEAMLDRFYKSVELDATAVFTLIVFMCWFRKWEKSFSLPMAGMEQVAGDR